MAIVMAMVSIVIIVIAIVMSSGAAAGVIVWAIVINSVNSHDRNSNSNVKLSSSWRQQLCFWNLHVGFLGLVLRYALGYSFFFYYLICMWGSWVRFCDVRPGIHFCFGVFLFLGLVLGCASGYLCLLLRFVFVCGILICAITTASLCKDWQ